MSFANVGLSWKPQEFETYLKTLAAPSWCKSITLHHTASPSLAQRPNGLTDQHIINIREFYKSKKWNRGPHLFVDDFRVMGMTPLTVPGIHAVSFNSYSIGIEMLGDYDAEDALSGRGLQVWQNAATVANALLTWLKLPANDNTILFHRDDPKTTKTCPGTRVKKQWILQLMKKSHCNC